MDIFVRNVPEQYNDNQVEKFIRPHLHNVGCHFFYVRKMKNKPTAFITIADEKAAQEFLNRHNGRSGQPLKMGDRILICREGYQKPDPLILNHLKKEQDDLKAAQKKPAPAKSTPQLVTHFPFRKLYCGLWEARYDALVFDKYYEDARSGHFTLRRGSLDIALEPKHDGPSHILYDIFFHCIETIAIGDYSDPHVTFTLLEPPRIAQLDESPEEDITQKMANLMSLNKEKQDPKFNRVWSLGPSHDTTAGCCLVYKLIVTDPAHLKEIERTLERTLGSPAYVPRWTCPMVHAQASIRNQIRKIENDLQTANLAAPEASPARFMPFALQFQFMRLVYNCKLGPAKTKKLLIPVQNMLINYSVIALAQALLTVSLRIPTPGPDVDASNYSTKNLLKAIEQAAADFRLTGSTYDTASRFEHLGMIYRVNITPTGMLLEGPELEVKNRVLRKYSSHTDHFLRVTFSDEDCEQMRHHRSISPNKIYHQRFRSVLTKGINICGRIFRFLGFSNSSLHTHQCWFMAPFGQSGMGLLHAPIVIQGLGDFSGFRSPAKCAARIGQTFSDATDTITINQSFVKQINDIERMDKNLVTRVFSDGVGTISKDLLLDVWKEFGKAKREHATVLQIRFQGAKGMLALDSTLQGRCICLRPSMIKFTGSTSSELEICGAGYKPMPLFLNRQFIKILEDLGVPAEPFLKLQEKAVENIKETMQSPINAARFLETNFVSVVAQIPQLIRTLWHMGYNFRDDEFLSNVVEMAAFYRLREIKYRGRIPVEQGCTLFGVVDETQFLKEDEIYASIRHDDGTKEILNGQVLITRSPALHPGDVQIVNAVKVPEGSPLQKLHNCVVFSQKGDRDLPSMLSGGDLDGDIFQIVHDSSLWPQGTFTPADYPRMNPIDIGRQVKEEDIIDFFLSYMESDQLGRIATAHLIVADQKANGTLSPECLTLAELHSTAVDFAKTGIAVNQLAFPKSYNKQFKPDFMATAPRMLIGKHNRSFAEIESAGDADEENPASKLGSDWNQPSRFYKSDKTLGQLYRAIDEERIHAELRNAHSSAVSPFKDDELMTELYNYVIGKTLNVNWEHRRKEAREIRSRYNETLIETAHQYSSDLRVPLAELEVFTGMILGRGAGMLSKRIRNRNIEMRDKFDRDVAFIMSWIVDGDRTTEEPVEQKGTAGSASAGLERSIACFAVAMEEPVESVPRFGAPKSFRYVVAGVCLKEIAKFNRGQRTPRQMFVRT